MASNKREKALHELLQSAIDAYQAGRLAEAIDHLASRGNEFPKTTRLWGYLGFLHGEAGDHAKAVQAFRKTVNLSPRSETASLGLFHNLWQTGKTNAAFREMRRFLKSKDSPAYRELLRDMLAEPSRQKLPPRKRSVA